MFRDSGAIGRVPALVPVKMDGEFPEFGENGLIPEEFETPDLNPVCVE